MLNSGHFLRKMDFTHILYIPKKKEPQSMLDYRPISLSNVISRLVSKVLAIELKLSYQILYPMLRLPLSRLDLLLKIFS